MPAHELPVARIAWAGACIGGTVLAAVVLVMLWLHERGMPPGGAQDRSHAAAVPGPTLQSAPQQDLAAYKADKNRELHDLAWADDTHRLARIPIEDAMAMMASRAASAPAHGTR
jgi:hypothetical protein